MARSTEEGFLMWNAAVVGAAAVLALMQMKPRLIQHQHR